MTGEGDGTPVRGYIDPMNDPNASAGAGGAAMSQEQLDELQERIDDERADLRADLGLSERHFIDAGSEEPVDDSIAPPG